MKRVVAPLALALLLACDPKGPDFFLTEQNGPPRGDLTGIVASGTTPIGGAKVSLSGTSVDSTTAGANGIYLFQNLRAGPYSILASAPNYNCTPAQGTVVADTVTTVNLACTPHTGSLAGNVIVNALPRAGVTVSAVQGTNTVATAVTGMNGAYLMSQLLVGAYNAVLTVPQGATCASTQQAVNIRADSTTTVDFSCFTSGTIAGEVRLDSALVADVAITISQGSTVVRTITTGALGSYSASGLDPGTYTVGVTPPDSATCDSNPRNVSVSGDVTTTANFDCSSPPPQSFVIEFGSPPFSYIHNGPGDTDACVGFTTNPVMPGASYTATWTGPGIVLPGQRTGTLDATGKAVDRQKVNQLGVYVLNLSISSGGFTANGSGSIDITAGAGTCPP